MDTTVDRTSQTHSSVSTEVRKYHVIEALGRGGFGTVYKAELLGSGGFTKTVALKVLNPSVADTEGIAERLRDEARMLGLLRHRAIVRVDGLHLLNGQWTVVMEFVDGVDLKRLLHAGPAPVGVALEMVEEVASALYTAYDRPNDGGAPLRVLHRDIKPSNIQLTPVGEVKVLDFGVARAEFANREAETRSLYFGSLDYMAPERMDNIDTHVGDIFSVGVVLYELIVGEQLGRTSGNRERHEKRVEAALDKLWEVEPDEELVDLVADCLAYDHKTRPDARTLERRAHKLRQRFPEPWLREWAETRVPTLLAKREKLPDELSGAILVEESAISSSPPPPASQSGPLPSTSSSQSSIVQPRRHRSSTIWMVASVAVGLVAVLTLGASALVGGWWFTQEVGGGDEVAPVVPPPVVQAETDAAGSDEPSAPERAAEPVAAEEPVAEAKPTPSTNTSAETTRSTSRSTASSSTPSSSTPSTSSPSTSTPSPSSTPSASEPESKPTSSTRTSTASSATGVTTISTTEAPEEDDTPTEPVDLSKAGKVLVQGDATRVRLVGVAGRYPPGAVPAGTYQIEASFAGAPYKSAGEVTVVAGRQVTLFCKSGFGRCVVR